MTLGILELNDAGLRISDGQKILAESPGIAVLQDKHALFGEQALRQHRLHPINAFSQFWHRLSGESLNTKHPLFRHHADLAYSHLLQLQQAVPDCDEIIFALPGSFSREQMSLLLGIVGQCSFNAVGLIDAAVAASANHLNTHRAVHIDIHLHQCIISVLEYNGKLQRTSVEVIPQAGILALQDAWTKGIAEQFLDQTRFDPLHSANTEQSLFDQLPTWLQTYQHEDEAALTIANATVKLSKQRFVQFTDNIFSTIFHKAKQYLTPGTQLFIGDRLAHLPGFLAIAERHNDNTFPLTKTAISHGIQTHLAQIHRPSAQLNFIQSLQVAAPSSPAKQIASEPSQTALAPTHCLIGALAYSIQSNALYLNIDDTNDGVQVSAQASARTACILSRTQQQLVIAPLNGKQVLVNGVAIADNTPVNSNDTIHCPGIGEIRLIHVVAES